MLLGKAAPPANHGAGWGGGSWFSDAFRSRRAPTPHELVDAYKSLVYACVNLNASANEFSMTGLTTSCNNNSGLQANTSSTTCCLVATVEKIIPAHQTAFRKKRTP